MAAIKRKTDRKATTKRKTASRCELVDTVTNKLLVRRVPPGQDERGNRR